MADTRTPASPKRSSDSVQTKNGQINYALSVIRAFDATAKISAVVRRHSSTLVKLHPGTQNTTHAHLASLTALKLAFPFCSVSAVENASSGHTEFQVLISTDNEAFVRARAHYRQTRAFSALRVISNIVLATALTSFACLMHAAAIRPADDGVS